MLSCVLQSFRRRQRVQIVQPMPPGHVTNGKDSWRHHRGRHAESCIRNLSLPWFWQVTLLKTPSRHTVVKIETFDILFTISSDFTHVVLDVPEVRSGRRRGRLMKLRFAQVSPKLSPGVGCWPAKWSLGWADQRRILTPGSTLFQSVDLSV